MLGDIGAAEDLVQDAFTRLLRAAPGEIADERGRLIVVTSRLCLDQIRSARSRRERAHDPGQIEAVAPPVQPPLADPADRVTFDDSVHRAAGGAATAHPRRAGRLRLARHLPDAV
jgi:RNA polymerase sigma-70 factor (ECF subfamily)